MILTVDLASKFTAWMVTDLDDGLVHRQDDSLGKTPRQVAQELAWAAEDFQPKLILIEDVPYGIKGQFQTKPVTRLQGRILQAFPDEFVERTLFINPATWQRAFPGVSRGPEKERIEAARAHAERLGYEPPNLVAEFARTLPEGAKLYKKDTKDYAKTMTDYVDAWLMGEWVRMQGNVELTAISGVQPA